MLQKSTYRAPNQEKKKNSDVIFEQLSQKTKNNLLILVFGGASWWVSPFIWRRSFLKLARSSSVAGGLDGVAIAPTSTSFTERNSTLTDSFFDGSILLQKQMSQH